jgi:hypothetical protein
VNHLAHYLLLRARDAVASATRDAGDIRCEVGIAPVFSWSRVIVARHWASNSGSRAS